MKEKINFNNCIKRKCEQCKYYNSCFGYKGGNKMLEGKVLKDFNDTKNNLKKYTVGKKFKADDERYKQLQAKGYVEDKEVTPKKVKE